LFVTLNLLFLLLSPHQIQANERLLGLDPFVVAIGNNQDRGLTIDISRTDAPENPLLSSHPHYPTLQAAVGTEQVGYDRASFDIKDNISETCNQAQWQDTQKEENAYTIYGYFADCEALTFTFTIKKVNHDRLEFNFRVSGDPRYNRTKLTYASNPSELFFGFGEQYDGNNVKGRKLPIWLAEQGHGRGLEPLASAMTLVGAKNSIGHWHDTYSHVPLYFSTRGRGLFLKNKEYLEFDFETPDLVSIQVFSNQMSGFLTISSSPLGFLREATNYTGRMKKLPDWTQNGAIIRVDGGSERVKEALATALSYDIPLAGFWIEDWMGHRKTLLGKRLWWNWEANQDHYPDWPELIQELNSLGVKVLIYFNPYLADVSSSSYKFDRNLYQEALMNGYLISDTTQVKEPFKFGAGLFDAYIVNLFDHRARSWLKEIMKDQVSLGVAGWMADFGEALPYHVASTSHVKPGALHTLYPLEWSRLNQQVMQESNSEDDLLVFHRSGNINSPRYARLFWTGDQLVNWDDKDGLKTVIPALTSSGLSGWSLSHSEVGGYLSVEMLLARYNRSQELFSRWLEISVFTAILRTHASNRPDSNHQWDSNPETLKLLARYSKLFKALKPYRQLLMEEAETYGYPIVRHPLIHYFDDPNTYGLKQQFMYGSEFWVAPVVDKNASSVRVYLPAGSWTHLWSNNVLHSNGQHYEIAAPIGYPAVFFKSHSEHGVDLRERLIELGLIESI
jgi:alpha-glucosidase